MGAFNWTIYDLLYYILKESGNLYLFIQKGLGFPLLDITLVFFRGFVDPKIFLDIGFFDCCHLLTINKCKSFLRRPKVGLFFNSIVLKSDKCPNFSGKSLHDLQSSLIGFQ